MHPAARITYLARCRSNPSLCLSSPDGPIIDTEKSGDATVADLARREACDQVGTLLAGHTDLLGGEVVRAIHGPALHALRISERDPDVTVERLFRGLDEIVLSLKRMQELDLEFFGDATRLILGVIGLIRLKGACRQFTLEVLGQAGDWIRFDQIGITIVQDFGVHDFGGDCRRVFLILGSVWCGGCGIIRH